MPDVLVVIPARWASSRFPGKVLARLGGRPLVTRVCAVAARAASVARVVVATDAEQVRDAVRAEGFEAELTAPEHPSGTDRVAEVAARHAADGPVIGLQADEPFLDPRDIDVLAAALAGPDAAPLATLRVPLRSREAWLDPNTVKVTVDGAGRALYFSRAPIPYRRPAQGLPAFPPDGDPPDGTWQHVGVYGWRGDALRRFTRLAPSPLERAEGLEQLRALEDGWTVRVLEARGTPFGIDTPQDLERAERWLLEHGDDR